MLLEIKRNDNSRMLNYTLRNENTVIAQGVVEKVHIRYLNQPKKWNIITYITLFRKKKEIMVLTIAKCDILNNKKVVAHV